MKMRKMTMSVASLALAAALPAMAGGGAECDTDAKKDTAMHGQKHGQVSSYDSSNVQSLRLSKVIDAKVTSQDGKSLGELEDLLIEPQTGQIKFAVLGHGGFLGIGEDRIPVPWTSINVKSDKEFTLNLDQQRLETAPKLDRDYSNLNDPSFASRIDQFYNQETAVGGSDSLEGDAQHSSGSSSSSSSDVHSSDSSRQSRDMDRNTD